jgi:dimethylamine corrinoid protein
MVISKDFEQLRSALAEVDEARVKEVFDRILSSSPTSQDVAKTFEAVQAGMTDVGQKFQSGEYYLAEMMFASEIISQILPKLKAQLKAGDRKPAGRIVLGTVKGDVHDIGKNLVSVLLAAAAFDVIDLGTDVPPERFVAAIREHKPSIVGLSGLLTLSIEPMRDTVAAIRAAGLRDQVKIIIGGNPITQHIHELVGSDAWTDNAARGVDLCRQWTEM